MMRVLLDENIDRLLKVLFAPEFEVVTVRERGWHGKTNGDLLRAAEREFAAFVTMDTNLEFQQTLESIRLGVVVIRTKSNAYSVVAPLMPKINEALHTVRPGSQYHF